MFGKKKKKEAIPSQTQIVNANYANWDKDLGFLSLIMKQKIAYAKQYDINVFSTLLVENTDYIKQKDIEEIYIETSRQIYESLGSAYKNFIVTSYFGSDESLLRFIEETVLNEFIVTAIDLNNNKMKQREAEETKKIIDYLNNKDNKTN